MSVFEGNQFRFVVDGVDVVWFTTFKERPSEWQSAEDGSDVKERWPNRPGGQRSVTVGKSSPASSCCAVRVYKYWAGVDDRFRVWRPPDFCCPMAGVAGPYERLSARRSRLISRAALDGTSLPACLGLPRRSCTAVGGDCAAWCEFAALPWVARPGMRDRPDVKQHRVRHGAPPS